MSPTDVLNRSAGRRTPYTLALLDHHHRQGRPMLVTALDRNTLHRTLGRWVITGSYIDCHALVVVDLRPRALGAAAGGGCRNEPGRGIDASAARGTGGSVGPRARGTGRWDFGAEEFAQCVREVGAGRRMVIVCGPSWSRCDRGWPGTVITDRIRRAGRGDRAGRWKVIVSGPSWSRRDRDWPGTVITGFSGRPPTAVVLAYIVGPRPKGGGDGPVRCFTVLSAAVSVRW